MTLENNLLAISGIMRGVLTQAIMLLMILRRVSTLSYQWFVMKISGKTRLFYGNFISQDRTIRFVPACPAG